MDDHIDLVGIEVKQPAGLDELESRVLPMPLVA